MNALYKKSLLKTAIATLLLTFMSSSSFSYTEYESITDNDYDYDYSYYNADSEEEKSGNLYMRFNYSGVSPGISSFSVKEDAPGIKTQKIFSSDSNGKLQEGYNPQYKGGFAGNASIGYKAGNFRVELEGLASSVTTDNTHVELENSRGSTIKSYIDNLDHYNADVVEIFTSGGKKIFRGYRHDNDLNFISFLDEQKELLSENFEITNEGLQNKAAMINAYYDINHSSNFTPYFGIGGGLTNVKFFGVSKITPAIQGKLGLHYNVSDKVQLSAGYRYFTALGNSSFSGIKLEREIPGLQIEFQEHVYDNEANKYVYNTVDKVDLSGATTTTVESKFSNHALELGLIFNF